MMAREQDIRILREMISKGALVPLVPVGHKRRGKANIELKEPLQPDTEVIIKDAPADAVVIKIDQFDSPDKFFACGHNECKRADFAIVSAEKACILYIEIKRGGGKTNTVIPQLQGAQCVIQYCRAIGKSFWNDSGFLEGYHDRYISFRKTGPRKRKMDAGRSGSGPHDTPQKALHISSPHNILFDKLVGRK